MKTLHRFFLCSIMIAAVGTLFLIGLADAGGDSQSDPSPKIIQTEQIALLPAQAVDVEDDGKLRIIIFGAHPDDAEYKNGGTAAKWAKQGHHVKLVSVTNGDIGHWNMAGGPLAKRRTAEVKAAAKHLGVTSEVLDIHVTTLAKEMACRTPASTCCSHWHAARESGVEKPSRKLRQRRGWLRVTF